MTISLVPKQAFDKISGPFMTKTQQTKTRRKHSQPDKNLQSTY